MMSKLLTQRQFIVKTRPFSTSGITNKAHKCKLLIIGGGAGGCSVAAKFTRNLQQDEVIIIEPSKVHYYQPMFTMIGGGIKTLREATKQMNDVLPPKAKWLQDSVDEFSPKSNLVKTKTGDTVNYDYLVIAAGLQLDFDKIPGLVEGLNANRSGVCSNYSPHYVNKTYETLQHFDGGNAVFTFPNSPVKCPGAPQKICYLTDHFLRKRGKRGNATITYNSSLPVIFGVKKYADALWKVVKERDISVNLRTNLIEVRPKEKEAVFENLDDPSKTFTTKYSMLHVTPPMSTPTAIRQCKELANAAGFIEVNKDTLQSVKFQNVFAIGDCSSSPNSKTAASVAAQSPVVHENLTAVMQGKNPTAIYDGYASCPLVTGYSTCILAEFDYNLKPTETFPISQDKERYSMYLMKKDMMPPLYWSFMLKGNWNGPGLIRKIMHLGMKS